MKQIILVLLFMPLFAFASVESCEVRGSAPKTVDSIPAKACGLVGNTAYKAAVKAGLERDIQAVIGMENEATCRRAASQVMRLQVENGNAGKVVTSLVVTEVECESRFFVSSPIHQFATVLKFWSDHDETEVNIDPADYFELKKLYEEP